VICTDVAAARRAETGGNAPFHEEDVMHAPVKHLGDREGAPREHVRDLADWLMDAALMMVVVSCVAIAVSYFVLLLIL
jgi:hypothetical protein